MDISEWVRLREFQYAPTLLGFGWVLVVISVLLLGDRLRFVVSLLLPFVTSRVFESLRANRSVRAWDVRFERVLAGLGSIGVGAWLIVEGTGTLGWFGAGMGVIGGWFLLDAVIVYRIHQRLDLAVGRTDRVAHETLSTIEATLFSASRPLTVTEIAERSDADEQTVRRGLAVLLAWGRVEPRRHGFAERRLALGRGFSVRDLLTRLMRPARLFSLAPTLPSRQY